jgi:hypothetical protein
MRWIILLLLVFVSGCAGAGDKVPTDVTDSSPETAGFLDGFTGKVDASQFLPDLPELDAVQPDLHEDAGTDQDAEPAPGEAGYPCTAPTDCNDGFCIQTTAGMQCTITCIEECPFDWICNQYDSGTDVVFICVPPFLNLCRPCMTNDECRPNAEASGALCVDYGQSGSFCGQSCFADDDCPEDYVCQDSVAVTGASGMQCVLASAECECTQSFTDEGAWTACALENEWGICDGDRACLATGLQSCSAQSPGPETCNSIDDDCDDTVDEGTGGDPCLVENGFGLCPGETTCVDGQIVCEGDEAEPEACDGIDNDCDGITDENFEDTDNDGIADCMENDKDGDEVVDGQDNCPNTPNPTQEDHDFDNFGDACDADDDNDETPDVDDCAPLDKTINPDAEEICDGLDNDCNLLVDEGFVDTDADSWKDCVDDDDDNDLSIDAQDCAPLDSAIHPDAVEVCDGLDNNCDEVVDEGFEDLDADGTADCVDDDTDGDTIPDVDDNCLFVANTEQQDLDNDGIGDVCDLDQDGDGVPDALDNCLELFNPGQSNVDDDDSGDLCDEDDDDDGLPDAEDNCPLVSNPNQEDVDMDGVGDACTGDDDGDGTPDVLDCAPLNPDIHPQAQEVCDGLDNDCSGAIDENFPDSDQDGVKDCVDEDDDGDGSLDSDDCAPYDAFVFPLAKEICNGVDDDCNNQVDDKLGKLICGIGECLHSIPVCDAGAPQFCNPFEGAVAEVCDGLDNDCDGLADEELGTASCGIGKCQHTVDKCVNGIPQDCDPFLGSEEELCDSTDNDCDGLVDENLGVLTCGQGVCHQVLQLCLDGNEVVCDPFKGASIEFCDGQDNDCDGFEDEELAEIICGKGECLHSVSGCIDGQVPICDSMEGAGEEICDGKDNDCDGEVDDNLGIVTCGLGHCQEIMPVCLNGEETTCDPFDGATDEVCDGIDNDCNGLVDDELPDVTCGLGICEHTVASCVNGQPNVCNALEGADIEICDDLDNSCDGKVDPPDSVNCSDFFIDADEDDFGVAESATCLCQASDVHTASTAGDCDDDDSNIHPDMAEECANVVDDNCTDGANENCVYSDCKALLTWNPETVTGEYSIDPDDDGPNPPVTVYCEMDMAGGGWVRISDVNPAVSGVCPGNWQYVGGMDVCRRPSSNCHAVSFGAFGVEWAEVRGQVLAYHYNSMDGFHMYNTYDINGPYVDGLSITHGSPRQHIWTYAVGISEDGSYPDYNCPCAKTPGGGPPGFVGADYYCESGNPGDWEDAWYTDDTLYDGTGCPAGNSCCDNDSLPWFQKNVGEDTTGEVEVRLCSDQEPSNEDIGLKRLELYVR